MTITLTSPDFEDDGPIPARLTCDGDDDSPALRWEGVPVGTAEVALLVEDPDAPGGTFVHWVLWGVGATPGELPAGQLPAGANEGRNDFGRRGWNGPCPPGGRGEHRYIFTLFAVSEPVGLAAGASANELRRALRGRVLAEGRLTGRYSRA
jgi:Raf kinase inhibitor-like YbhB/YbcL family protein